MPTNLRKPAKAANAPGAVKGTASRAKAKSTVKAAPASRGKAAPAKGAVASKAKLAAKQSPKQPTAAKVAKQARGVAKPDARRSASAPAPARMSEKSSAKPASDKTRVSGATAGNKVAPPVKAKPASRRAAPSGDTSRKSAAPKSTGSGTPKKPFVAAPRDFVLVPNGVPEPLIKVQPKKTTRGTQSTSHAPTTAAMRKTPARHVAKTGSGATDRVPTPQGQIGDAPSLKDIGLAPSGEPENIRVPVEGAAVATPHAFEEIPSGEPQALDVVKAKRTKLGAKSTHSTGAAKRKLPPVSPADLTPKLDETASVPPTADTGGFVLRSSGEPDSI